MSSLRALVPVQVTGVGSFYIAPGVFYLVDTTAGSVTALLPPTGICQPGDWAIIKNSAGSNSVVVTAWTDISYAEFINGAATSTLAAGNTRNLIPGAPAGGDPSTGNGWMSF